MATVDELQRILRCAKLAPKVLAYLARTSPDVLVEPGEYVAHEGEGPGLILVLDGLFEV